MKTVKLLISTALVASSFSPVLVAPAFAAASYPLGSAGSAFVTDTCASFTSSVLASEGLTNGTNPDGSPVVADEGSTIDGGTTSGPNKIDVETSNFQPIGTPTYSDFWLNPNTVPYRIGGSVNMFGSRYAHTQTFADSSFDESWRDEYSTTYSFTCDVTINKPTRVLTGHHNAVHGAYVNHGGNICKGIDPDNPNWGQDQTSGDADPVKKNNACTWDPTNTYNWAAENPLWGDYDIYEDSHEELQFTSHTETTPVQFDYEDGFLHHDFGGGQIVNHQETSAWFYDSVVICNSPGKKGGTWTKQNGYTGALCTTAQFDSLATVRYAGTPFSQGTYISVPK